MMHIFRSFLILIFLFGTHVANAGWSVLASDKIAVEYVNLETIERDGYFVKMWNLSDFATPQEIGNGMRFRSTKALQEYDCVSNKKRLISLIHYTDSMGKGTVAYHDANPDIWRTIVNASLGEQHLKAACQFRK